MEPGSEEPGDGRLGRVRHAVAPQASMEPGSEEPGDQTGTLDTPPAKWGFNGAGLRRAR